MLRTSLNVNPRTIIVIRIRTTNATNETAVINFCDKRSSFVQHIPEHNQLIIDGDGNSLSCLGFIMTMMIVISFARELKTAPNDYALN